MATESAEVDALSALLRFVATRLLIFLTLLAVFTGAYVLVFAL